MIVSAPFIWKTDYFVYHLTHENNMNNIMKEGLIPKCGARSQSVGDKIKAIYFFSEIYNAINWIEELYPNEDINKIDLLKFNLKRRKWHISDSEIGDYYLTNKVDRSKIQYISLTPQDYENLSRYINPNLLSWTRLEDYKPRVLNKEII